ncbi:MAG TPA: serine hydrolase [Gemmatimonadaceae bacterium]|nr:serine hydrolase [Gemmatimonadaceae bacterium]
MLCALLAAGPLALRAQAPIDDRPSVPPAAGYAPVAQALEAFIQQQMTDKAIPAVSIALVDDQRIVWARGFGFANPRDSQPASATTVYRVGSVSKLLTGIGIMQLVERGRLSLDTPVTSYLPDFTPHNPFGVNVTLRELLAHRSGLPLEPPVGSYFDSSGASLESSVASLSSTALVYKPGTRTKYSNAGIATAGYVIEQTNGLPFEAYMQRSVLDPAGMRSSAFAETANLAPHLATGTMWTYEGRRFPAPTFPFGEVPAVSLYSTVSDLGRFLSVLFANGRGPGGELLRPSSLAEMWRPQYDTVGEGVRFGLTFAMSQFDGRRRFGHGGSVYGFGTEVTGLPEDKLGVVVVTTLDGTSGVANRIAEFALRAMLANRAGTPSPKILATVALPASQAMHLDGWYHAGTRGIFLHAQDGSLYAASSRGGERLQLKAIGDTLVTDDRLGFGDRLVPLGYALIIDRDTLWRAEVPKPDNLPPKWQGLVGEYGWNYNTLYILERGGRLTALIQWFEEYPLVEVGPDTYAFPDWGVYDGERVVFSRDPSGQVTQVVAGGVTFPRRPMPVLGGPSFEITPTAPVDQLKRAALAAQPPTETGDFLPTDLVDPVAMDSSIKLDVRYATPNNFLGAPVYPVARAFLQRPAAEALVRVSRFLRQRFAYGIVIHDAYRPWYVTKMFWDGTPPEDHVFVADPSQGSKHNRGAAVDLGLYDLYTGQEVTMPSGYDEMSDRAYAYYPGGSSIQRWNRDLLRSVMERNGFTGIDTEWWHFDYKDWQRYRIGNVDFEKLIAAKH